MAVSEARAEPGERAGERFEAFYVREYHGVVRLAYALSGSRLVAEDIAQDVFLRAYLDWQRIRSPAAWVRKVTVRRAGRVARRRLLEARALARLLAGRGPAVAELPLHRSVAEVDVMERLERLEGRRRRYRATGVAVAILLVAAVTGAVAVAARQAARPGPATTGPALAPPGTVTATIAVPGRPTGVAVGAGAVWVTTGGVRGTRVVRIDPASNRLVASVAVPDGSTRLAVGAGAVWVVSLSDNSVSRIDPASNRVTPVAVCCGDGAAGAGGLWVANGMDRSVLRVDAATGRVVARVPLPPAIASEAPFGIAAAGGLVWVTSESTKPRPGDPSLLWRVDPADNRFAGTLRIGTVEASHITPTVAVGQEGTVWAAVGDRGAVLRVRPHPWAEPSQP
jgi:hypothetical protein